MLSLAIVLTVQEATGSPSAAGGALAALGIASAVMAPLRGRLVDRFGARRALPPLAASGAASLIALALAAAGDAPAGVLIALAGVEGMVAPPLIASARVVWPLVVAEEQLGAAYGLQALMGDLGNVVGPALAGALTALASPGLALLACGLLPLAGALVLTRLPWPSRPLERMPRLRAGALASTGVRLLAIAEIGLSVGLGALDVALPALAERDGDAATAAVPLAAFATASALVSLWYGGRRWHAPAARRYLVATVLLAVAFAPLAAGGSPLGVAALLLLGGAAFAAVNVVVYELLDLLAPKDAATEAFTWLTSANAAGIAAGAVTAGQLAGAGEIGLALALPCAGAVVAVAAARAL
jgi:predicted MFS family arabinose efflux permease